VEYLRRLPVSQFTAAAKKRHELRSSLAQESQLLCGDAIILCFDCEEAKFVDGPAD
jgi:hypothetical protein